jgi:2-keto-4-pentenoate hydratase/2-oxohepta-3-ene-1,7-dioic acid hydratase in catechol pathway
VREVTDTTALAVDLTARNVQDAVKKKGLPWSTAKGFDTFCPVGYVDLFQASHHEEEDQTCCCE